jgi:hypothetical protein
MAVTLSAEELQDDLAISLARVLAAANKQARESGIDVQRSLITISQLPVNGEMIWRVNYGPKEYVERRGGDLIVEVSSDDASVKRVLKGQ